MKSCPLFELNAPGTFSQHIHLGYLPSVAHLISLSRLETTLIYAYADTEQKRKAIEKAIPEDSTLKAFLNSERYRLDDDDLIKQLYGLK